MQIVLFYVTHAHEEHARQMAQSLLDARLIACANVFPISSMYLWQGEMAAEQEYVSILKTIPARAEALKLAIEQTHPYDTPCIVQFEVTANEKYGHWVASMVVTNAPE